MYLHMCVHLCVFVCVCVCTHSFSCTVDYIYTLSTLLCRGMLSSKKESLKQLLSGTVVQWTLILNAVLPANRAMALLKLKR